MSDKKPIKEKNCRVCTFPFVPRTTTQKVCSPNCAIELNRINKSKAYDAKTKELKSSIKKRSEYEAEAQKVVNLYIRIRDRKDPCISCGRHHEGQYHAGHYKSVGAFPELRYHTSNIHKQCSHCNKEKSGNIILYRQRLVKKIGIDKVDWIEGPHDAKKYSISDLVRIRQIFTKKLNWLKNIQSNTL